MEVLLLYKAYPGNLQSISYKDIHINLNFNKQSNEKGIFELQLLNIAFQTILY